ncbi:hypothetical protein HYFRA_00008545 [Hymenoscyphus fraxineus]|uniref:Uncharacterized protein n=1 Tax=Hymenoscyphus fraxineus TaxID=746836 RepID=A0A9N9PIS2_9HELO|nr:hypothetical protein HYFRA_00008545 [Hymenoscyphus fraxineus]
MAQHPNSYHDSMMQPNLSITPTRSLFDNFSEVMPSSTYYHHDPTMEPDLGGSSAHNPSGISSEGTTSSYSQHNPDPRNSWSENPYIMSGSFEHRYSNPISMPSITGDSTSVDRAGWLWTTDELRSMVETMQREKNNRVFVPQTTSDSGFESQDQLNEDRSGTQNEQENPYTTTSSLSQFENSNGEESFAYADDHFADFDPATPQDTRDPVSTPDQAMWDLPLNNMDNNAIANIASGNGHPVPTYKAMAALRWRNRRAQRSHVESLLERNGGQNNGTMADHGSKSDKARATHGRKRKAEIENSDDTGADATPPPKKKAINVKPLRNIDMLLQGNKPDPNYFPPARIPGKHMKMDFTPKARIPADDSPTDDEAFTHRDGRPTEKYKAEQKSKRMRWVLGAFEAADGNDSSVHAAPPGGIRQDLPPFTHHRYGLMRWLLDRRSPLVPATATLLDCVQFIRDAGNEMQWKFKNWAEGQAWITYQQDSRAWQNAHRREKARKKAKK